MAGIATIIPEEIVVNMVEEKLIAYKKINQRKPSTVLLPCVICWQ